VYWREDELLTRAGQQLANELPANADHRATATYIRTRKLTLALLTARDLTDTSRRPRRGPLPGRRHPSGQDGAYDLTQVTSAVHELAPYLERPCLIVGKSTVSPGTAANLEALAYSIASAGDAVEVAWNPEFLREGTAVADTLTPDRIVIGADSAEAERTLRALYAPITRSHGCPQLVTDPPVTATPRPLAGYLTAAFAEIERTELLD
jgi:hypothetical protein